MGQDSGNSAKLLLWKTVAIVLLLPGLAGLLWGASISVEYLHDLPTVPDIATHRTVPRNIHGTVVYQTEAEDSHLNMIEYTSIAIFVAGLIAGVVYLENWATEHTSHAEEASSGYSKH